MLTLEPLRADHADALLAFERENRAYFARSVPDRGRLLHGGVAERHRSLLAEQHARVCHFHVVLDEGEPGRSSWTRGNLVGRVNLVDVTGGCAELATGWANRPRAGAWRGVARAAVAQVCRLAATGYGLTSLTAVTTLDDPALHDRPGPQRLHTRRGHHRGRPPRSPFRTHLGRLAVRKQG
ncbi:GNAT family N-acetyltransferase [Streptomyces azureus]|uniref:Ribosomal-protein-alanine acetyltransferase n=1 Tax=Streptomyces azureus TaxID=146537 RepID=A0A0K8PFP2_STRAJ|nr:GNAT family N-acetyltransferase [Streptomyces azureus]GAP46705.1 ribosomal-protein-alanine acetyltransferase [Streptomyces azureus]